MSMIATPTSAFHLANDGEISPPDGDILTRVEEVKDREMSTSENEEEAWEGDVPVDRFEDLNNNSTTMLPKQIYKDDIPSMVVSRETNDRVSMATNLLSKLDSDDEETLQKSSDSLIHRRGKRKKYQKYSQEDRIAIGKYCFEHGPAAARKAFQSRYPEMSESVTRGFRDKYKTMIGETAVYEYELERRQREAQRKVEPLPRGRPRKVLALEDNYALPTMVESKSESSFTMTSNSRFSRKPEYEIRYNEKLVIGNIYMEHGMAAAIKESEHFFDDVSEDFIMQCYHLYMCNMSKDSPISRESLSPKQEVADRRPSFYENNEEEMSPKADTKGNSPTAFRYPRMSMHNFVVPTHKSYEKNNFDDPLMKSNELLKSSELLNFSRRHSNGDSRYQRMTSREFLYGRASVSPCYNSKPNSPSASHERNNHSPIIHYPKVSPVENSNNDNSIIETSFSHAVQGNQESKHEFLPKNVFYCNNDSERSYRKSSYLFHRQHTSTSPNLNKPEENTVSSSGEARSKRFKYQKYTPEDRFNIGKLCNEIGLGATVKVYREKFPRLNESVVRTFRNRYRELLEKGNGVPQIEAIERKPSSRRSHSTASIEGDVVNQLHQFRLSNIDITENLAMAVAENILARKDPKEASSIRNAVNRTWANTLLWKHKLVNKPVGNAQGVCCERCKTLLVCPKC